MLARFARSDGAICVVPYASIITVTYDDRQGSVRLRLPDNSISEAIPISAQQAENLADEWEAFLVQ